MVILVMIRAITRRVEMIPKMIDRLASWVPRGFGAPESIASLPMMFDSIPRAKELQLK